MFKGANTLAKALIVITTLLVLTPTPIAYADDIPMTIDGQIVDQTKVS